MTRSAQLGGLEDNDVGKGYCSTCGTKKAKGIKCKVCPELRKSVDDSLQMKKKRHDRESVDASAGEREAKFRSVTQHYTNYLRRGR